MTSAADAKPMPSHPHDADDKSRGLRILHATDSFLPNVGGLEFAIAALVRSQVSRGQAVAVATSLHPDAPASEDLDGAQVHRLPMAMSLVPGAYANPTHLFFPPVPDPRFTRAFADLVGRFRPDVIHAHGWILYSVLGAARRAGVPVVATAHDHSQVCATKIMLYHGRDVCSGPGLSKCIRLRLHPVRAEGDSAGRRFAPARLATASRRRPMDGDLVGARRPRFGAPPGRPQPDGGDPDVLSMMISSLLPATNGPPRGPISCPQLALTCSMRARWARYKGVDVLLDAHARLRAGGVDIPLVLAGLPRGDFRIGDRAGVVVATNVPHPAVVAALRHAVVGVVPSLVPEGFGLVAVGMSGGGYPVCGFGARWSAGCGRRWCGGFARTARRRRGTGLRAAAPTRGRARCGRDSARPGPAKAARFTLSQVIPRLDEVYLRVMADAAAGRRSEPPDSDRFNRDDRYWEETGHDRFPAEDAAKRAELDTMPLVLMYHSVSPYDEDPHEVTMTPQRFERHMRWLRARGLRGVAVAELLSERADGRGRGLVGLTFDDGYQDFVTYAVPVLQRYGFTATVFVLAGLWVVRMRGTARPRKSTADGRRSVPSGPERNGDRVARAGARVAAECRRHAAERRDRAQPGDPARADRPADTRVLLSVGTPGRSCREGGAGRRFRLRVRGLPSPAIGRHAIPRTYVHDRDTSWRLDAKRIRSGLMVGNRIAVRRHRSKARSSQLEYL